MDDDWINGFLNVQSLWSLVQSPARSIDKAQFIKNSSACLWASLSAFF